MHTQTIIHHHKLNVVSNLVKSTSSDDKETKDNKKSFYISIAKEVSLTHISHTKEKTALNVQRKTNMEQQV